MSTEDIHLSVEQLAFLCYMQKCVALKPELNDRFTGCIESIVKQSRTRRSSKNSDSETIHHHSPQRMIEFLSLFSRDDRFKWYTHKWDMATPFNIDECIEQQIINKDELNRMAYPKESGPAINESTYNQVWNFINFMNANENAFPWKNTKLENVKKGWHSIVEISKEKPDIPVENLILDDGHQFKDYVRQFKATIEFRTDLQEGDRFSELVWKNIKAGLPKDFDVTFSSNFDEIGYDLNVYCDVIGLLSALHTLCNWMTRHKASSSTVIVDLTSEEKYYILKILHKDSYFNNKEKLINASGDFASLRKRLFSVCDFSMAGDLMQDGRRQGALIVRALDNGTTMKNKILSPCTIDELHETVGGVLYEFKIYKR